MHIDVSRAFLHVKVQWPLLVLLPVEDHRKNVAGNTGLFRECTARGTPQAVGNVVGRTTSNGGRTNWRQNLFHHKNTIFSGMTHGDVFLVTGPTSKLIEPKNKLAGVYPIGTKIIRHGSTETTKALS